MNMDDALDTITPSQTLDPWVCPNDRQLALRAKLHSGWSVKSNKSKNYVREQPLSESEQELVVSVIRRAEKIEKNEHHRVGRLVERVCNIQKNAHSSGGDGIQQCALCAENCGMWSGGSHVLCHDCQKLVCQKCSVDSSIHPKEPKWLCKLCLERREVWKKSGAWFYKVNPLSIQLH